jgi:hypothetical protein
VAHPKTADLEALLLALQEGDVAFVLVGGAAAVSHGAPVTTQDLDVVPDQDAGNLERFSKVLAALDARFRPVLPNRDLAPTLEHLSGTGHLNLTTSLGPLDVLCRLEEGLGFPELLARSIVVADQGLTVRVIDLDMLIEVKRRAGRAKDLLTLPVLIALRDELASNASDD